MIKINFNHYKFSNFIIYSFTEIQHNKYIFFIQKEEGGFVMRKYLNYAGLYAIAAMVAGVFYREFTKWNGFTGETMLGKVHGHLFFLGMLVFIIVALFERFGNLDQYPSFKRFKITYNIGLPFTAIMMMVRGITEVLNIELTRGMDYAISGLAGIAHILTGVGLIFLLSTLQKCASDVDKKKAKHEIIA